MARWLASVLPLGLLVAACTQVDLPSGCATDADCLSGRCEQGACVAMPTCTDGKKNDGEADVDCGGPCLASTPPVTCAEGKTCAAPEDCATGNCEAGKCAKPVCKNGRLDADESDLDCGGSCGPCPNGKKCRGGADCASASCDTGTCAPPDCTNGVLDGQETGPDCGGPCVASPLPAQCKNACKTCEPGLGCALPRDCRSGRCINNTCAP